MIVVIENSLPFSRGERSRGLPGPAGIGGKFRTAMTPTRLLVQGASGDMPQPADHRAIQPRRGTGHLPAGRLVHNRHELVREPRHRATDTDTTHIRAPTDTVHPTPLGDIALHH